MLSYIALGLPYVVWQPIDMKRVLQYKGDL